MSIEPCAHVSTTATLALGDALAVALVHARNFTSEDFALSHPAGALGRQLLTRVEDLMHTKSEDLPLIHQDEPLQSSIYYVCWSFGYDSSD